MWRFGRYSGWNKRKSTFPMTPSHLKPPGQRTPANIRINPILLETVIPGLHLCRWLYRSIFIQIFVVDSERHVSNVTKRIIAVQGQFRVIQGRWFWYKLKARMRFPISNLGPILHRLGDTVVYWAKNCQNCQFVPTPVSEIALARGDPFRISWWTRYFQKLEWSGSPLVKKSWR